MTALADALADIGEWLPRAAALTASPDTAPTGPGGKPGSRPPWNQAAAGALWDALGVIADTEAMFRFLVTGHPGTRRPASATGAALAAIARLGHAVPQDRVRDAARELARCVMTVQQLPAVDEIERAQRVAWPCPYCEMPMVRLFPRSARVACLRGGSACQDANGNPPIGHAEVGRLGPCIVWADGLVS